MEVARFIRNTVLFLGLFLLLSAGVVLLVGWLMGRVSLQLPEGVNTLVLGDSQIECAVNDSTLTQSANLSMGGEAILYSHIKARAFFEANPAIDTIWLSYNFHSLTKRQDTLTRSERYNKYKLPFHFFLLETSDLHVYWSQLSFYTILMRTPYVRRQFIRNSVRRRLGYKDLKIGSYQFLERDRLHQDIARRDSIVDAHALRPPQFGQAMDQVEYLDKLVALCKEKGVACILVNTPVHPVIMRDADTAAYYAYHREHLSDVPLWDHSQWQFPDSCFGDATHLNHRGAKLYSERLRALRNANWVGVEVKGP